jgi:hypothetical protein
MNLTYISTFRQFFRFFDIRKVHLYKLVVAIIFLSAPFSVFARKGGFVYIFIVS